MIFNNTIEIILPKFDNEKKIIDWDEELKKIGLSFGGYTLFKSGIDGIWYDGNDRYSDENMDIHAKRACAVRIAGKR